MPVCWELTCVPCLCVYVCCCAHWAVVPSGLNCFWLLAAGFWLLVTGAGWILRVGLAAAFPGDVERGLLPVVCKFSCCGYLCCVWRFCSWQFRSLCSMLCDRGGSMCMIEGL